VANIIISKIESKSQQLPILSLKQMSCGKYHYFKDRKQITTAQGFLILQYRCGKYHYFKDRKQITTGVWLYKNALALWQISLFQRSKANHNQIRKMRLHR